VTRPILVVIAGPNGSGKSTLTDEGNLDQLGLALPSNYINPDNIRRQIVAERSDLDDDAADKAAFWRARELREEYRSGSLSFAFETVFSHPSNLVIMDACRLQGYDVRLLYVTTANVEINVQRVEGRVRAGKHYVHPNKIRNRYTLSHKYSIRAFELARFAWVFDTTGEDSRQLCIQKDDFLSFRNLPKYMVEIMRSRIEGRHDERVRISNKFGEFSSANIQDSAVSDGDLIEASSHFFVQRTLDGELILHDRLQFDDEINETIGQMIGQRVMIVYNDGFGLLGSI
jgi:predicted ABC-type ATPase